MSNSQNQSNNPSPASSMSGSSTTSWHAGPSGTQPIAIPRPAASESQTAWSGGQYSYPSNFPFDAGSQGGPASNDNRTRFGASSNGSSDSAPSSNSQSSGPYIVGTMDLAGARDHAVVDVSPSRTSPHSLRPLDPPGSMMHQRVAGSIPSSTRQAQSSLFPTRREFIEGGSGRNGVSPAIIHPPLYVVGQQLPVSHGRTAAIVNGVRRGGHNGNDSSGSSSPSSQSQAGGAGTRLVHGSEAMPSSNGQTQGRRTRQAISTTQPFNPDRRSSNRG